ncbi:MAG: hypothetical protein ACJATF_003439 [Flavobacteriales bacterium]
MKHSLQSNSNTTGEITINSGTFTVAENTTTKFFLDFDVRKAIKKQDNPEANDEYDFVTEAELRSSVRIVNKDTEVEGQGSSEITFKNATSSCIVEADGSYTLSFLSEGEYELHYVSYEEEGNDGSLEASGMLEVDALLSLDILALQLDASADVTLDVTVLAVNPI